MIFFFFVLKLHQRHKDAHTYPDGVQVRGRASASQRFPVFFLCVHIQCIELYI